MNGTDSERAASAGSDRLSVTTDQSSVVETARRPSAVEAARRPSAVEAARRPSAVEAARRPSAVEAARRPSAVEAAGQAAPSVSGSKPGAFAADSSAVDEISVLYEGVPRTGDEPSLSSQRDRLETGQLAADASVTGQLAAVASVTGQLAAAASVTGQPSGATVGQPGWRIKVLRVDVKVRVDKMATYCNQNYRTVPVVI